jgi:hypothetical protein
MSVRDRVVLIKHNHKTCRVVQSVDHPGLFEHIRTCVQGSFLIPYSQIQWATHLFTGLDLPCNCAKIYHTSKIEIIGVDVVRLNLRCQATNTTQVDAAVPIPRQAPRS